MSDDAKKRLEMNAMLLWAVAFVVVGVVAVMGYIIVNGQMTGSQQFVGLGMILALVISVTVGSISILTKSDEDGKKKD